MAANRFVGAWRLISFEHTGLDGHAIYPFGRNPRGLLTYTADGCMCVAMAAEDYQGLSGEPRAAVSEREAAVATGLYLSFAGRYEANETVIVHHIEICLRHNWVGGPQVRQYAFAGNRLTLSTGALSLVWERVAPPS